MHNQVVCRSLNVALLDAAPRIRSTQHTAVETWELHASQSAPELLAITGFLCTHVHTWFELQRILGRAGPSMLVNLV